MNNSISRLCSVVAIMLLMMPVVQAAEVRLPIPIPDRVRLVVPAARQAIQLQKVDVQAEVLGGFAHTRVEMVFFNPNNQLLEGELQFPLLAGQSVTGFALDINGELRDAVPVDKSKGQQVFEDVSRARIDPALLEQTQGNNYKLRVYPLPARGTRRVVLEIDGGLDERVTKGGRHGIFRLPLQFAEKVGQLDVTVNSPAVRSLASVRARLGAEKIAAARNAGKDGGTGAVVSLSRKDYAGREVLRIAYPDVGHTAVTTGKHADQTYFYAEVAVPDGQAAVRQHPQKIGLVWDASGSGAARDHGREFALLDGYFRQLGEVAVELVIARDRAEAAKTFKIEHGDWRALRAVLESLAYDGATAADALSPPAETDLNLLFSDGLMNYGMGQLQAGGAPLYAVSAAVSADTNRLRAIAEGSGARLLDLQRLLPAEAVAELTRPALRLTGLHSNGARDLISDSAYPERGRVRIAGVLTEPLATVTLEWADGSGHARTQDVVIRNAGTPGKVAATRWAVLQLARLEADYANNRAAIRRLGARFGMVTRETSLMVLDRVEDYVRYEIEPPESLRAEYQRLLADQMRVRREARVSHLDGIAARFAQKTAWWEKDFPKGDKPKPKVEEQHDSRWMGRAEAARPALVGAAAPASVPSPVAAPAPMAMAAAPVAARTSAADASSPPQQGQASIQLKKWQPDAPYAQRLHAAEAGQMYQVYLDERPAYANSTAFFLDAADIFIERGQTALGLRILSNLAEMNLENRQILRILAYRLLQARQVKLALPILKQVLALSPDEPQSWRDLGLACAEAGQYQQAVDDLWEVVARPWQGRFPDIELVALAELNAIIARVPQGTTIDTGKMDARLLRNLPLGLRAVLSWDADNTDIDLWVTDPNGEKVYYANRLGYQGGAMSSDFTGGYGPEEFSLRFAKPGVYKVQAHFYGNRQQIVAGATTLMLRLTTGFGTADQQDQNIILRLTGQGEVVDVGTFEVGKQR